MGFPHGLVVKNSPANAEDARDMDLIPESGRSPGRGNSNPFQYSCLENPMDRGAWQAIVHGSQRVRHEWATEHTHTLNNIYLWRQWNFRVFVYICVFTCLSLFSLFLKTRNRFFSVTCLKLLLRDNFKRLLYMYLIHILFGELSI